MAVGTRCSGSRLEGRLVGRAVRRLDPEEARPIPKLAVANEVGKAAVRAEHVAAVPQGHDDVVGRAEADLSHSS